MSEPHDSGRPFVGRRGELDVLVDALARARTGKGTLVAVTGEAGIGKTRLVEELVAREGLRAPSVLWGRCTEQAGSPSYWPWTRVLRAYASAAGIERLRETLGADVAVVAPLLPALEPSAPAPSTDAAAARYRLFEAVIELLRRLATAAPLVVVLEDLHWADDTSLALLELLAQELDDVGLLVIVTYRERERSRLPRPLAEAVRRGQRIALQGLDATAVGTLTAHASGNTVAPALVERLAEATGGNPFFLGEVLRTLVQEGRLDPDAVVTLPDTVRDSIRRHLDQLGDDDRDVLALAAVAGQTFEVAVLADAASLAPTVVLERLHAPVQLGLVTELLAGRFRFVHALVRETLYVDLLPARRVHLHAQVGAALEQLHGEADAPLGALASHFLHAAPLGTAAKAVDYATRAGERAMALYAYQDALVFFEQALAVPSAAPLDRTVRLRLRMLAADAARTAGLDLRACNLLLLAAEDARALGDRDMLAIAATGYYILRPNIAEPDPETIPLLEEALAVCAEGDGYFRATLMAILAAARTATRYAHEGAAHHDALSAQAVEMGRRLGDVPVLAATLLARQLVVIGPGSSSERLGLANEALVLTRGHAADLEHLARASLVHCHLELGDVAAASGEVEQMARTAERVRVPERQWQVAVRRASIALLEGRFDDGARLAAEALAVRRSASDSLPLQVFVLQMFLARRDTGQHGGLEGSIRWMVEHHPETRGWHCVLAVFLADVVRAAETRAVFERLAAGGFARLREYQNYHAALAWLSRVTSFLWDVPRAGELYPLLLPYADQNIVLGADAQACLGSAHRYLALLLGPLGRPAEAEEHFQAAIAMNERMGARAVLACTQHEYSRLLQYRNAPGDRVRGRELLDASQATAEACGMTQLLEWVERLGPIEVEPTPMSLPSAVAPPSPDAPSVAVLRREGDVWLVGFTHETFRMKDAKGVQLLAALLRNPGQDIHVLELDGGLANTAPEDGVVDRGDAGPLLDPAARRAYRQRVEDLRDELEEAERFNDAARVARARHELEFVAEELARGVGLGGRDRRAASASERARVNVTRTIGAAIKRIASGSPRLGEHLRASVRTGYACVYATDPTSPVRWEL